ncbi:uncharacterized protein DAT39_007947, partial [Clarias magur]
VRLRTDGTTSTNDTTATHRAATAFTTTTSSTARVAVTVMTTTGMSAPVPENQCTTLSDSQFRCDLPTSILRGMLDPTCHAQWSMNDISVAIYETGKAEFEDPITAASLEWVIGNSCNGPLVFYISCPKTDFNMELSFSCENKGTPEGNSSVFTPNY